MNYINKRKRKTITMAHKLISASFEIKHNNKIFTVEYTPTGKRIQYEVSIYIGKGYKAIDIHNGIYEFRVISPKVAKEHIEMAIENLKQ